MPDKSISDLREEVVAALEALEALVITVDFDCEDPDSVEVAIQKVEAEIDAAVGPVRGHPLIESAVSALKAECREGLYRQAERAAPIILGITTKPTLH
ncbi:hypothetical protein [Caballeronia sp. HLA56]